MTSKATAARDLSAAAGPTPGSGARYLAQAELVAPMQHVADVLHELHVRPDRGSDREVFWTCARCVATGALLAGGAFRGLDAIRRHGRRGGDGRRN